MQSLHLLGIVEISPRRGTKVRALSVESVIDLAILSGVMGQDRPIADVFEFRDAMESATAELCARNASGVQIESIRHILEENAAAVARGDRAEAQRIDVRFHAKIADASGNVVFHAVAHALNGLLVELRKMTGVIPGAAEASFVEHQEIFAAIARRDGPAARKATERHIRNTRARYESRRLKQPLKAEPFAGRAGAPARPSPPVALPRASARAKARSRKTV
jgi:DNA-binding FadR family transcriptional regulator